VPAKLAGIIVNNGQFLGEILWLPFLSEKFQKGAETGDDHMMH